jgi:hypothetical protein
VPNGFQISTSGAFPPKAAGSFFGKLHQAALTAENSLKAEESIVTGGSSPSDADVRSQLAGLHALTPYKSVELTHADYSSSIPGSDPRAVFQTFVNNPAQVFAAGGLTVRPAVSQLQDGQRLMLQASGTPPLWMPIEVHLDPENSAIHITTLDGHPFRGTNDFQFGSDGHGGTRVIQRSAFQGSSELIKTAGTSQLNEQHDTWRGVHAFLYQQCANRNVPPAGTVHGEDAPYLPLRRGQEASALIYLKPPSSPITHASLTLDIANEDPKNLTIWLTNSAGRRVDLPTSALSGAGVHGTFDLSSALAGQTVGSGWQLHVFDSNLKTMGTLRSWSIDLNRPGQVAAA